LNEKLDDMLLELGALKDYMPNDNDLEGLKKYNKPVNLPPLIEDKKTHNNNKPSPDQQLHT